MRLLPSKESSGGVFLFSEMLTCSTRVSEESTNILLLLLLLLSFSSF